MSSGYIKKRGSNSPTLRRDSVRRNIKQPERYGASKMCDL